MTSGASAPIVGSHFRPGGAARILGYSAREFRNQDVPLADIWSRRARTHQEIVRDARAPARSLELLENLLTRYALIAPEQHPATALAIDEIHRPISGRRIRDLAADSGLSQRRFIEVFTDQIGLTPKLYARIQRFQRTVIRAALNPRTDWADLAFEFGYSDQAHLIRDFREFSGLRPSEYAPRRPDQPNHVPLDQT